MQFKICTIFQSLFDIYLHLEYVLFQRNIDGGEGVHSPAGVLVRRRKQPLHECPYEVGEASLHDALSHREHQVELQRETFEDTSATGPDSIMFWCHFVGWEHFRGT